MKKLSNNEAELKKSLACIKKACISFLLDDINKFLRKQHSGNLIYFLTEQLIINNYINFLNKTFKISKNTF